MRLGFIGLGHLGAHLARSLLRAGFALTVHDLERERAAGLIAAGAAWGASPRQVAAQADSVITCLPSPAAVAAVVEGEDGVLAGLRPGGAWIEMSTNDPEEIKRLAALAEAKGIACLEAPVTGGVHKAATGEITVLVGGDEAVFAAHRPAFAAMGGEVLHIGPLGSASVIKVITNMLAFIHLVAAGEALMLARRGGIDLKQGIRGDPRELGQQLRPRDREPGDPLGQLRHRLHDGSGVQGPGPRAAARARPWRAVGARRPCRADLPPRPRPVRRRRLVADGGEAARGRARHRAARAGLPPEPATGRRRR